MAYAQWIEIKIVSENMSLIIQQAHLNWGKFYQHGDKDKELSSNDINNIVIKSGKSAMVCSCGRSDASSGTEGSFELYDGNTKIGKFKWDCPWGSKKNSFSWEQIASKDTYIIQQEGGNKDSGAIGNIIITCLKN